jgi:hypothetical protein
VSQDIRWNMREGRRERFGFCLHWSRIFGEHQKTFARAEVFFCVFYQGCFKDANSVFISGSSSSSWEEGG